MKTTFDTDTILFQLLNGKTSINGGVYTDGDRPDDSTLEDIEVNTIDLEADALPQIGTSNVNIYVPDTPKTIAGKQCFKASKKRLRVLANEVLAILRNARIEGLTCTPGIQSLVAEPSTHQHFYNIRVNWNIQN